MLLHGTSSGTPDNCYCVDTRVEWIYIHPNCVAAHKVWEKRLVFAILPPGFLLAFTGARILKWNIHNLWNLMMICGDVDQLHKLKWMAEVGRINNQFRSMESFWLTDMECIIRMHQAKVQQPCEIIKPIMIKLQATKVVCTKWLLTTLITRKWIYMWMHVTLLFSLF